MSIHWKNEKQKQERAYRVELEIESSKRKEIGKERKNGERKKRVRKKPGRNRTMVLGSEKKPGRNGPS